MLRPWPYTGSALSSSLSLPCTVMTGERERERARGGAHTGRTCGGASLGRCQPGGGKRMSTRAWGNRTSHLRVPNGVGMSAITWIRGDVSQTG